MKVVKPDKMSMLQRVFEHEDGSHFVVSLLVAFHFDAPRALLSEVDMWKMAAAELEDDGGTLDEGQLKVRGEVLVSGRCFAPRGEPVEVSQVRVAIAGVDKRLAVIGDRFWRHGVPTKPEPFVEMPVDWTHAFGGEGYEANPVGKGFAPVKQDGGKVHALPNIELVGKLINAPGDRPTPAGFGAMDFSWPQRRKKAGTYDAKWLETRFPAPPVDMDPTLYNTAPEDQQLEGYFAGEEQFVIENMHSERSRIEGKLPDVVTRAFVTQKDEDDSEHFREIAMRLDSVRFIPHQLVGVLVFRGVLPIHSDDAHDIVHLVAACEAVGQPRSIEHYRDALAQRLDKEKGALLAFKNSDLMPDAVDGWAPDPEPQDVENWLQEEGFMQASTGRRLEQHQNELREYMKGAGLDPADQPAHFGELATLGDGDAPEKMSDIQRHLDDAQERMDAERERLVSEARARFAEAGMDFDAESAKAQKRNAGPPKLEVRERFELVRRTLAEARAQGFEPPEELERMVNDTAQQAKFEKMQEMAIAGYRKAAHLKPPVERIDLDGSAMFRAELEAAHLNDITMENRDYSGADLSELDLAGIALEGALFEGVNLTDTNLAGAMLNNAVLAHATLTRTQLSGASLVEANLGAAVLEEADLSSCQLRDCLLHRTKWISGSLSGAELERVVLLEAQIGELSFSGARARQLIALQLDMHSVDFTEAVLDECVFIEVDLSGVSFARSQLNKTSFLNCKLDGASFAGATLSKCMLGYGTTADDSDLTGADLTECMLGGARLRRAKLDGSILDRANLMGTDLREASLYRARARGVLAIRANFQRANLTSCDLLGAMLQKARLEGANLLGASLFGADLARVRYDADTNLRETDMGRAVQIPKHKEEVSR